MNKLKSLFLAISILFMTACGNSESTVAKKDCALIKENWNTAEEVSNGKWVLVNIANSLKEIWIKIENPQLSLAVKEMSMVDWRSMSDENNQVWSTNGFAITEYCEQFGIDF
jgi:hypothetical protein